MPIPSDPSYQGPALSFRPWYEPNAFFCAIFVIIFLMNVVLSGIFWRFWGHAIGMLCGLLLELLGYAAKVQLSHNRSNKSAYIMYIIGLTLGPTFLSSSLYLCSGRLRERKSNTSGDRHSFLLGPRSFATLFISGDFLCLCFIGVGGSLAAIYSNKAIGVDLMVAGLATQVLVTVLFCISLALVCAASFKGVVSRATSWYIVGVSSAAFCLLIRCCWRVAELSGGFNGPLTSKEGLFIALDSIPMVAMSSILTVLHPVMWSDSTHFTLKSLGCNRKKGCLVR